MVADIGRDTMRSDEGPYYYYSQGLHYLVLCIHMLFWGPKGGPKNIEKNKMGVKKIGI